MSYPLLFKKRVRFDINTIRKYLMERNLELKSLTAPTQQQNAGYYYPEEVISIGLDAPELMTLTDNPVYGDLYRAISSHGENLGTEIFTPTTKKNAGYYYLEVSRIWRPKPARNFGLQY
ncbi:hypothetical protein AVEN_229113-1 [Araneus ventricosus]|uniref:Uncharacterized protein n=1 Tax=Araneus ventricosus TaxID=182803 RepID=A0A4Y2DHY9_ARAVE|nr:hypothetical protein AVEN_229113-1 [Araneus ventricosus]